MCRCGSRCTSVHPQDSVFAPFASPSSLQPPVRSTSTHACSRAAVSRRLALSAQPVVVDMSAKLSDGTLSESSFSDSDVSFHDPHAVGIDYYSGSGDSDIDTEPLGGKRDNRDEENEVPRRGHGKGGFKNLKNRKRRKWVMRSVESQGTTSGGSNTGLKVALAIGILLVIAAIAYGLLHEEQDQFTRFWKR